MGAYLRAVGVGPGVCHGEDARSEVLEVKVLIREPAKQKPRRGERTDSGGTCPGVSL